MNAVPTEAVPWQRISLRHKLGEGASGGALGIGVGDKIFMLENSWYTVISPENCSSILWRSWDQKEKAAEELRLTPENMYGFGLIDEIVPEPIGGAHWDYNEAAALLKPRLVQTIKELKKFTPEERINNRIEKLFLFLSLFFGTRSFFCFIFSGFFRAFFGSRFSRSFFRFRRFGFGFRRFAFFRFGGFFVGHLSYLGFFLPAMLRRRGALRPRALVLVR